MKNITITLDEETAAWVRIQAAEQNKSVSRFVGEHLQTSDEGSPRIPARISSLAVEAGLQSDWRTRKNIPRGKRFMTALVFVDTNVFVYARDPRDPVKQVQSARLDPISLGQPKRPHEHAGAERVLRRDNSQVPSCRSRVTPLGMRFNHYLAWNPQSIDAEVLTRAREIERRHLLSWWDCLDRRGSTGPRLRIAAQRRSAGWRGLRWHNRAQSVHAGSGGRSELLRATPKARLPAPWSRAPRRGPPTSRAHGRARA